MRIRKTSNMNTTTFLYSSPDQWNMSICGIVGDGMSTQREHWRFVEVRLSPSKTIGNYRGTLLNLLSTGLIEDKAFNLDGMNNQLIANYCQIFRGFLYVFLPPSTISI